MAFLLERSPPHGCQDRDADLRSCANTMCYEPMRSPVLIFRPFRSWTISSVRPGHSPALSMPMLPANLGRHESYLSRGRPPSPQLPATLVSLRERTLER